jgi:plasmid stability protein
MSQREQQTARVNVDDATWKAFRIRAIQANRSVAERARPPRP